MHPGESSIIEHTARFWLCLNAPLAEHHISDLSHAEFDAAAAGGCQPFPAAHHAAHTCPVLQATSRWRTTSCRQVSRAAMSWLRLQLHLHLLHPLLCLSRQNLQQPRQHFHQPQHNLLLPRRLSSLHLLLRPLRLCLPQPLLQPSSQPGPGPHAR